MEKTKFSYYCSQIKSSHEYLPLPRQGLHIHPMFITILRFQLVIDTTDMKQARSISPEPEKYEVMSYRYITTDHVFVIRDI